MLSIISNRQNAEAVYRVREPFFYYFKPFDQLNVIAFEIVFEYISNPAKHCLPARHTKITLVVSASFIVIQD
jgi:hypothetical protein